MSRAVLRLECASDFRGDHMNTASRRVLELFRDLDAQGCPGRLVIAAVAMILAENLTPSGVNEYFAVVQHLRDGDKRVN